MIDNLKYPIGTYQTKPFSTQQKNEWLLHIQFLPQAIEKAIENLDEQQLQTPYRPDGWTVHQLVHHVADSHINAYTRFKLGLTEDNPTIKAYDENEWTLLADVKELPINISITLLHALHIRWHTCLKNITDIQWQRTVVHSETGKQMTLFYLLGLYAWHSLHHTKHITALQERNNW